MERETREKNGGRKAKMSQIKAKHSVNDTQNPFFSNKLQRIAWKFPHNSLLYEPLDEREKKTEKDGDDTTTLSRTGAHAIIRLLSGHTDTHTQPYSS